MPRAAADRDQAPVAAGVRTQPRRAARVALQRTDRPKRDCAITLHADFVHAPETMEEMVKRSNPAPTRGGEQGRIAGARTWQEGWRDSGRPGCCASAAG